MSESITPLPESTPIIMFGDDWGRHASTVQHIIRHIVPLHPVVWLNSFGHRIPRLNSRDLRRAVSKVLAMARKPELDPQGTTPQYMAHPKALPWHTVKLVRRVNNWSFRREFSRGLRALGCTGRPIFITGTPVAAELLGQLGECVSIYYCLDEYAELPGVSKSIVGPLEKIMLERVDAVVATAAALVDLKRPSSGLVYQLPQGVNYEHFSKPQAVPDDLAKLPRPWIGFAGTVDDRCDVTLLRKLASEVANGSVVMVGNVTLPPEQLDLPNIHLLGRRPYDVLPGYVQAFDVGIVPYVKDECTRSIDPLKLLEYLAAGIPTVITALPEASKYSTVVSIAGDHDEFIQAVMGAIDSPQNGSRDARQRVAAENTWEKRARRFLNIVAEVIEMRAEARRQ